jgi:hypothetical protein
MPVKPLTAAIRPGFFPDCLARRKINPLARQLPPERAGGMAFLIPDNRNAADFRKSVPVRPRESKEDSSFCEQKEAKKL